MMGTVELEDIEVGSVGMNSQNLKWYFWKKEANWTSQEKVNRQNSNLNPPSSMRLLPTHVAHCNKNTPSECGVT